MAPYAPVRHPGVPRRWDGASILRALHEHGVAAAAWRALGPAPAEADVSRRSPASHQTP